MLGKAGKPIRWHVDHLTLGGRGNGSITVARWVRMRYDGRNRAGLWCDSAIKRLQVPAIADAACRICFVTLLSRQTDIAIKVRWFHIDTTW